jgi:hypothetical protein
MSRIHGNAMPSALIEEPPNRRRDLHYGNDTKAENRRPTVAHVEDRRQQAGACTHAIAPAYISVLSDSSLSRVTASALAVWWLAEKTHFRSSLRITLCGSSRVTNCQINDGVSKYRQKGAFAIPMNNGNSCQSESLEFVQFGAESAVVDCAQAARSGNSVICVYPSEPQTNWRWR